jgi:hypothetical protein
VTQISSADKNANSTMATTNTPAVDPFLFKGKLVLHMAHTKSTPQLLSTGLDFLSSAAEHQRGKPKPRDLKYAILHLCAGTELILKERLLREHWSLVFDDLRSATRAAFETGDFKSVAFNDAINRLSNVVGLDITVRDQQVLERLRKKRNQLEHFGIIDSSEALVAVAAEALNFITDFISTQFPHDRLKEEEQLLFSEITSRLRDFNLFVQKRWAQVEKRLASITGTIVWCPACAHDAAVVARGTKCLFCGTAQEAEEAAMEHIVATLMNDENRDHLMDDLPLYTCASCQLDSIVDCKSDTSRPYRFVCFACGKTWDGTSFHKCALCHGLFFEANEDSDICELCRLQD